MRYLLWIAAIVSVMTCISVIAEAQEGEAARVAPKVIMNVPTSNLDPIPPVDDQAVTLPRDFDGASIEVGFAQDNEPEPHLLATVRDGKVELTQLPAVEPRQGRALASVQADAPTDTQTKSMPKKVFLKRLRQALDENHFFSAAQPRPKARCHDKYMVRIRHHGRTRERRGCTNQSNDPFAGFAQLFFRDAFIVWGHQANSSATN